MVDGETRPEDDSVLAPAALPSVAVLYEELRRIARRMLRGSGDVVTMQPTALVHEALLRLMGSRHPQPAERTHYLALHAKVMRQVILDEVRRARADKRSHLRVDTGWIDRQPLAPVSFDLEALDGALEKLEAVSPERARVVELRFYVGLSIEEIAGVLGASERSVKRWWQAARAWLMAEMQQTLDE